MKIVNIPNMNTHVISRTQLNNDRLVVSLINTILEKRHIPLSVLQISRIIQQYGVCIDLENRWSTGSQTRKLQYIMNEYSTTHYNQQQLFVQLHDGRYTLPHIHQMMVVSNLFLNADFVEKRKKIEQPI